MKRTVLVVTALMLLAQAQVAAQQASNDSTIVEEAARSAYGVYTTNVGIQSHLYNGSQYADYVPDGDEHPYLFDDWVNGDMTYNGEFYPDVPFMYNLLTDQLIATYPYGSKIALLGYRVKEFTLGNRNFVRLNNDQVLEGFYEVLYSSDALYSGSKEKFYARRSKTLTVKVTNNQAENIIDEHVKYFIEKDGVYHKVKNWKSVLNVLSDKKKELKEFKRTSRLDFSSEARETVEGDVVIPREQSITKILAYYDKIQK